jgi:hypothetical protein
LHGIEGWLEFWQHRLGDKVNISDIEAEGALQELDRIMKIGIQKTKQGHSKDFVDSFYLKRII